MSKPNNIRTIRVTRTTDVEVADESVQDAIAHVREMYEGGDACAELGDATYDIISMSGEIVYTMSIGNLDTSGEETIGTYGDFDTAVAAAQETVRQLFEEDGLAADGYKIDTSVCDDGSTVVVIQMPIADSDKMEDLEWWRITETKLK